MKALSVDLRKRIVAAIASGESRVSAAKRFQVSRRTIYSLLQKQKHSGIEPIAHPGNPTPKKMTPEALEQLRSWLQEKNDMTLEKIQRRFRSELGIQVSQAAIWKRMRNMKLTWKKNDSCS